MSPLQHLPQHLTDEKTEAWRLSDLPLVTQLLGGDVTKPYLSGPKRVISTTGPHCPAASSLKLILCIRGFTSCNKSREILSSAHVLVEALIHSE